MASPVSQQIKNLKGGISQQPENLRYPNQGDVQINCWSSEAEGLQKRPPSVFVKKLDDWKQAHGRAHYHLINRDEQERYIVQFCGTRIRVYDLEGQEYTVNGSENHPYVVAPQPQEALKAVTVADYTFVVNNLIKPQEDTTKTHAGYGDTKRRALIGVRGGQYGRTLSIKIGNTVVASYEIPDGSAPEHVKDTDSAVIIQKLVDQINTNHSAYFEATGGNGYIVIRGKQGNAYPVETSDGYAGTLLSGLNYQTSNMNKLPIAAPDGYLVEITGEVTGSGDSYWVRYDTSKAMWQETVAPNVNRGLKASTMPHALVREANGQFYFRELDWTPRLAGDEETNPMPSFIGRPFNDVFYFRNRLGFLSGENVILSKAGQYFDMFPASVAVLNDDDPIDIAVSHNQIAILKYAVPFSENLLLWAGEAQFVLSSSGGGNLTSRTVTLELTTQFYVGDSARPYGIDRGVFFVSPRATYSTIKRYYTLQDVSNVRSAEDISAHVPNYIPNDVFHMHGSGTENFLLCLTNNQYNRSVMYIYKYLYMDEELVQQAWSHWDFGEDSHVLSAFCIGSYMWVLLQRGNHTVMERIEFTKDTVDASVEPYRAYIDMKTTIRGGTFDEDTFRTTFHFQTLYGMTPPKGDYIYLRSDGSFVNIEHDGIYSGFHINGDASGETGVFGKLYPMNYKFSKFLPKTMTDDGGVLTEDLGRLQLGRVWVNYNDTGSFEMQVYNGSSEFRYIMGGGRYGTPSVILGDPMISTGTMRFPVSGNAKLQDVWIVSDNPTPVSIVGCGWEGRLIKRARSI